MKRRTRNKACSSQMEFEFVASIPRIPRSRRARRRASSKGKTGALNGWDNPFDEAWLDEACERVVRAKSLREAVKVSASYLAELIEEDIRVRGYCEDWHQEYEAYCSTHYYSYSNNEDESIGVTGLAWLISTTIFATYERLDGLSDWDLYEVLCSGEDEDEASTINLFSSCVWALHDLVINGGLELSAAQNYPSED